MFGSVFYYLMKLWLELVLKHTLHRHSANSAGRESYGGSSAKTSLTKRLEGNSTGSGATTRKRTESHLVLRAKEFATYELVYRHRWE